MHNKFVFTVSFWGEAYRDIFLKYSLSSLLSEGNIPELINTKSLFLICTTKEDWLEIQNHELIKIAKEFIDIEFIELKIPLPAHLRSIYNEILVSKGIETPKSDLSWNTFKVTPYDIFNNENLRLINLYAQKLGINFDIHEHYALRIRFMTIGHKIGFNRAKELNATVFFVGADHITATGAIKHLIKKLNLNKKVILTCILRFDQYKVINQLERIMRFEKKSVLSLSARNLVKISFSNLHPETECMQFNSPFFCDTPTSIMWKIQNDSGVLINNLNFFPLVVNLNNIKFNIDEYFDSGSTIDGKFISKIFNSEGDIDLIDDSDDLYIASLTPSTDYFYSITKSGFKNYPFIGKYFKAALLRKTLYSDMGDAVKRKFYKIPIKLHSEDISPKWNKPLAESKKIINLIFSKYTLAFLYIHSLLLKLNKKFQRNNSWALGDIHNKYVFLFDNSNKIVKLSQQIHGGKWYFEILINNIDCKVNLDFINVNISPLILSKHTQNGSNVYLSQNGIILDYESKNSIIQVALDLVSKRMWIGLNGSWFNSGDPDLNLNPSGNISEENFQPSISLRATGNIINQELIVLVEQKSWHFKEPIGFLPLVFSSSI